MELNAIVLSFVLDFLDVFREDDDAVCLRTVSRDFQKTLYDVILKPEAIQEYMRTLFERNRRTLAKWPKYTEAESWFCPFPITQFGWMKPMLELDRTYKRCRKRLFISRLQDIDVFIWFLRDLTSLKSDQPYHCGPDSDDFEQVWLWYCIKLPALRTLRWFLRAAVQHTKLVFVWDTCFEAPEGYEGHAFGVSPEHCLSWTFRPRCSDRRSTFPVRQRLRSKQAAQHLFRFEQPLITIIGDQMSDMLWEEVLRKALKIVPPPLPEKLTALQVSVTEQARSNLGPR